MILRRLVPFILLCHSSRITNGYLQGSTGNYLANFNSMMSYSYSAVDDPSVAPTELKSQCSGNDTNDVPFSNAKMIILTSPSSSDNVTSLEASSQCDTNTICVVPEGITLRMMSSLNVGALIIKGTVWWDTSTQQENIHQWLCAGYVAVEEEGVFHLDLSDSTKMSAWIYLKNNGATHDNLRTRAFGAAGINPTIDIRGREMVRTWSLLARPLKFGETTLQLMHDPVQMGWRMGDRIAVAPTDPQSRGTGQSFRIVSMGESNVVTLDTSSAYDYRADFFKGNSMVGLQSAEVVNLSRNVIITGDDFAHTQCRYDLSEMIPGEQSSSLGCRCSSYRSTCTLGLHVVHMFHGEHKIQNVRVEKCGQRGIEGKYCLHLHKMGSCPECLLKNNAIENSHGRGIIIHGTHLSKVSHNVLYDVRGAGLYIEDGNELYNTLDYNVVICPWPLKHSILQGCTLPGTSNDQADTELNQAGIFSVTPSFNCIGNRVSNSFNGMLVAAGIGRGEAFDKVCTSNYPLGRFEGNTFHSGGRFGTYYLNNNYPKVGVVEIEVSNNGYITGNCEGFTSSGVDAGLSTALSHHFDYGNAFVGHYNAGDIQYKHHMSIESNNLLYWKESKSFSDGCSSFLKRGYYRDGNVALPDQGTLILEDMVIDGGVTLEANHHCNVGVTGVLCMPEYILENVKWVGNGRRVFFQKQNFQGHMANQNHGGIFSLSPDNTDTSFFPVGYVSLVSHQFDYLLDLDGICHRSDIDLGLDKSYDNGILCKRTLRALKIYTRNLVSHSAPSLMLEVWDGNSNNINEQLPITTHVVPFHQVGSDGQTDKQGYSLPVIVNSSYMYRLSLQGEQTIPTDWVVEFSDPVMGNRYGEIDTVQIQIAGRDCGEGLDQFGTVTSQHDRKYIWGDSKYHLGPDAWGRGACSGFPDEDVKDCIDVPDLEAASCPSLCTTPCPSNAYCACGVPNTCICNAGFYGPSCEESLCDATHCAETGTCSATFLGSTLPVSQKACICDDSYGGPLCDLNPCEGISCSGHGTCVANGDSDWTCSCEEGYGGKECESTCTGFCMGIYPYGCSTHINDDIVSYWCNPNGGCHYSDDIDFENSAMCPYKIVDSSSCTCSAPNDCQIAGKCDEDGNCPTPTNRANGTPCNSKPGGFCRNGACTLVLGPTSTPSTKPSLSPVIPIPSTTPSSLPTQTATVPPSSKPSREFQCDGFCQGSYPYGCAVSVPNMNVYRCGPNYGCHYAASLSDSYPSGYCTFDVVTPSQTSLSPTDEDERGSSSQNPHERRTKLRHRL